MERNKSLYRIIMIGLMAAIVYVATTFIMIPIPTPLGRTMIKSANAVCVLAGILLGGVGGGLAAGIGSALSDLFVPEYVSMAWLTLIRFFLFGLIAGLISHANGQKGRNFKLNLIAAIVSALFSYVFYIASVVIQQLMLTMDFSFKQIGFALTANYMSVIVGAINVVIAVLLSMVLVKPLMLALDRAGLLTKIDMK
jgi:uncharacterized membrane protein